MANKKSLYIVVVILVLVVAVGLFFFLSNDDSKKEGKEMNQPNSIVDTSKEMVNCGKMEDPFCFINRMNECLPVTAEMIGSDNTTKIEMIILGIENEKCHFQRKLNNVLNLNCFFPKGTMNQNTLDQTFGNDKGLQKVVDDACNSGW